LLHLAIVVTRFLAAQLPAGSVTALDYATRAYAAVMEVVGSGVLLVALTDWSAVYARGDTAELGRRVARTVTLALFALIPVTIVIYAVREPLIALWLGGAAADAAFRHATAATLGFLVVALPLEMIGRIYVQLLVVRRETATVGAIAALRTAIVILLAVGLVSGVGVAGIGLAETLAACVTLVALAIAAHRLAGHSVAAAARSLPRLAAAALGAVTVAYATRHLFATQSHLAVLGAVTVTTLVAYVLLAWLLRAPEFRHVFGYLLAPRAPRYTAAQVS
jgi:putative peptidoglycan lipid II flippase